MATVNRVFADRREAGIELARAILARRLTAPMCVLGLARGGVPVALEVAKIFSAPLDVLAVRKVGMPGRPEFSIGAVAPGNVVVREPHTSSFLAERGIHFEQLADRARADLESRERRYRSDLPALQVKGTVLLVDEGLVTGCTMLAAVRAARQAGASCVIVAAPVATEQARALVSSEADQTVLVQTRERLVAVSDSYRELDPVEDTHVRRILEEATSPAAHSRRAAS